MTSSACRRERGARRAGQIRPLHRYRRFGCSGAEAFSGQFGSPVDPSAPCRRRSRPIGDRPIAKAIAREMRGFRGAGKSLGAVEMRGLERKGGLRQTARSLVLLVEK